MEARAIVGLQTRKDAFFLVTLLAVSVGFLCSLHLIRGQSLFKPPPLPQTVNPNRASVGSLVRLPGIGPVRAAAICKTRQTAPYQEISDLIRIKGIGPATAQRLESWLTFQADCQAINSWGGDGSVKEVGSSAGFDYDAAGSKGVSRHHGRMGNP
ncbi:ComEA family DNA-binding protein [Planctomycetota bacterium]